jgi:hypothetical protein
MRGRRRVHHTSDPLNEGERYDLACGSCYIFNIKTHASTPVYIFADAKQHCTFGPMAIP